MIIRAESIGVVDVTLLNREDIGPSDLSKVYARVTNDQGLLRRAMNDINRAFPDTYCSSSPPTQLIIITWIDYKKINTKQVSIRG